MKRILIIAGHYGSGKTEYAVNLAVHAARTGSFGYKNTAVVDMDVVNPYFRSRERGGLLAGLGVKVYGSFYGGSVTAEIPELSAEVRAPLEDKDTFAIVDAGGNESGARILKQFAKYFTPEDAAMHIVVNASRPETRTVSGALRHIAAIESELGFRAEGLIGNTHLLRETTAADIQRGYGLCLAAGRAAGLPLVNICYPSGIVDGAGLAGIEAPLMPLDLYMRESWLDK
ncbi:MAG: hypothetical protein FWG28_03090 [Clostridiales bacterium]|nr:hypothetical protein [Clostridiales bacterium]